MNLPVTNQGVLVPLVSVRLTRRAEGIGAFTRTLQGGIGAALWGDTKSNVTHIFAVSMDRDLLRPGHVSDSRDPSPSHRKGLLTLPATRCPRCGLVALPQLTRWTCGEPAQPLSPELRAYLTFHVPHTFSVYDCTGQSSASTVELGFVVCPIGEQFFMYDTRIPAPWYCSYPVTA